MGYVNPLSIGPGDIVHTAATVTSGAYFGLVVIRHLVNAEVQALKLSELEDWLWVMPQGQDAFTPPLTQASGLITIPSSSVNGLIKSYSDIAAIAAYVPEQVQPA